MTPLVCDFCPDAHEVTDDHARVPHDEVAEHADLYAQMLWDMCPKRTKSLLILGLGSEANAKADLMRFARGASEHAPTSQKGDWCACPSCYAKWQELKKSKEER